MLASVMVVGNRAAATSQTTETESFVPLKPSRVVDTRLGAKIDDGGPNPKGRVDDGTTLRIPVTERGGVPADAAGVVLNLTAPNSTRRGHVVAYACGATRPSTSNLNLQPGDTVSNLVIAKVGSRPGGQGEVCLYVRGSTDIVVDIFGYIPAGGSPTLTNPARIVDTRAGTSIDDQLADPKGRRADRSVLRVPVAGRGGVPAEATGAVLNLTAVGSIKGGHVVVYACDDPRPSTSNLNLQPGETVSNLVMTKLSTTGDVCVYVRGSTHVIVDVMGYLPADQSPTLVSPTRIVDTRAGTSVDDEVSNPKGRRANGSVLRVPVVGRGGVPSDATGVVLNVASPGSDGVGHIVVFACDERRPPTSNLNLQADETVSNLVITKIGARGDVCLFVRGSTDLVVDVNGFIAPRPVVPVPPTTSTTAPATTTTTTTTAPATTTTTTTTPPTTTTSSTTTTTSSTTSTTTSSTSSTTSSTTTMPPTTTTTVPASLQAPFKRNFNLAPMGTAAYHRELYESAIPAASLLEPVGIYLDEGDVVYIEMTGGVGVDAQVGMGNDGRVQRVPVGNGLTQLVATTEGALFLSNQATEHTAKVTVYAAAGIKQIPTFRFNETTDTKFLAEVRAATEVPKILLIGKYFMAYVHRDSFLAANYITGTVPVVTSPKAWVTKRDRDIRMYHTFAGKDETVDHSNANAFQVSREMVSTGTSGYMDARGGYINMNGLSPGVTARLFDMDSEPSGKGASYSAGPWHEFGHHQQQYLMAFPNAGEGAPNIYNGLLQLHSGNGYGFGIGRDYVPSIVYSGDNAPADATEAKAYHMHYMYMQLFAAFGEGFYARLHHEYRLIDHETAARTVGWDEMSLFAYLASKAAEEDLTPFFESWKMPINAEYTAKIAALGLPTPKTDLSERRLTEITSPADMEGKYENKLEPYSNLPVANAKSDFMLPYGATPSPYDLIDYDPAIVKTAEFLNPTDEPFKVANSGKPYGETMVEILLTGFDGQQNVVVAGGMIAPASWGANPDHAGVFLHVYNYVRTADFQNGVFDPAEAELNLEMISGTYKARTADLIQRLVTTMAQPKAVAHHTDGHYVFFKSISSADTMMYQGKPALRINAQLWQTLIDTGQLVIRAYEETPTLEPTLGYVRNGRTTFDAKTLNLIDFVTDGPDVIVFINAPFETVIQWPDGRSGPMRKIRWHVSHQDENGAWRTIPITMDATHVGLTDQINGHWVDEQFLPHMAYLESGDKNGAVIFATPEHSWNTINRAGDLSLRVYRNGALVGYTDGTTTSGIGIEIADGTVSIRVPNPGLAAGDVFELKGTFTSDTSPDLNGRVYLQMTANMLSPDLPIQLS